MGPRGVRAMQGSLSPQDYPIWYAVHLLLHREGSKPQRQAHDEFLPFITHWGKGLGTGPGASADRNDIDIPDTSITRSEKVLAASQCCVLSRRKNLSLKNYCSHLIEWFTHLKLYTYVYNTNILCYWRQVSCARRTARPDKPEHWSSEQRKAYCRWGTGVPGYVIRSSTVLWSMVANPWVPEGLSYQLVIIK